MKSAELVAAIDRLDWEAALPLTDTAEDSLQDVALLNPFRLPVEVRCEVKGQAPWQVKLKTRAERCTGVYHPSDELVNGMPCYKKIGSDKESDGQVLLCFTSNGPGHERYMIQHVRVRGESKGYARCKLTQSDGGGAGGGGSSAGRAGRGRGGAVGRGADGGGGGSRSGVGAPPTTPAGLAFPAPHQVRLWQVHDGIDWSVCDDFLVTPLLPIPLLVALECAQRTPACRLSSMKAATALKDHLEQPSPPDKDGDRRLQRNGSAARGGDDAVAARGVVPSSVAPARGFVRLPSMVVDSFVAPCLSDVDVSRALAVSRATCAALAASMAARPQWRVIAAVLERDPKAAELKMRNGSLPRDVASAKGAPLQLLDAFVQQTPYTSLAEATARGAHSVHLDRIIGASPLAMALQELGFGPVEIGRLMADNSLGLNSEEDLVHLRYDELVRAGVTAVNARKAMGQLQALRASSDGQRYAPHGLVGHRRAAPAEARQHILGGAAGGGGGGGGDCGGSNDHSSDDWYVNEDDYYCSGIGSGGDSAVRDNRQRNGSSFVPPLPSSSSPPSSSSSSSSAPPPMPPRQEHRNLRRSYGANSDCGGAVSPTATSTEGEASGGQRISSTGQCPYDGCSYSGGNCANTIASLEERLLGAVTAAAERDAALRESVAFLARALTTAVQMATKSEERVARLAEQVEALTANISKDENRARKSNKQDAGES